MNLLPVLYDPFLPQLYSQIESLKKKEEEIKYEYYILKRKFSYPTLSIMGKMMIEVDAGEVFTRIIDDPTNFSNGFTILKEELLKSLPNWFDPANKIDKQNGRLQQ